MQNKEILCSKEFQTNNGTEFKPADLDLSITAIDSLYKHRKEQLESIKNHIYLKFYYQIEEKLKKEQQVLMDILDGKLGKKKVLAQYSFVLDPQYFEQKFFKLE
jgi:hypothetical protein